MQPTSERTFADTNLLGPVEWNAAKAELLYLFHMKFGQSDWEVKQIKKIDKFVI
jgi:hypothetical protein